MKPFEALWKTSVIQYRMQPMPKRIASAVRLVEALLARAEYPYLAFSGGKDSLVCLDLLQQIAPDTPVLWFDEDWVMPGTYEYIEQIEAYYDIRMIKARGRYASDGWYKRFEAYPVVPDDMRYNVQIEGDTWQDIIKDLNFDGVLRGLRAEESSGRHFALKKPLRQHGDDYRWHVAWSCAPIYDWTWRDVWAYIAGRDLPVHSAYEQVINAGVEPRYARVGPLVAVDVYQYGTLATVRRVWPNYWYQFEAHNPCVGGL